MLRIYVRVWLLLSVVMFFESFMLNFLPDLGIIGTLKAHGFFPNMSLNIHPGKSISLFLGWTGFGLMCASNVYSVRKRFMGEKGGPISHWLDFHIFCGLVGPTFILFHSNFKIGGLVAISFWSMVVSFLSGVVGRYFYLQIAGQKNELDRYVQTCRDNFARSVNLGKEEVERLQESAQLMACIPVNQTDAGIISSLYRSLRGDLRMHFSFANFTAGMPADAASWLERMVIAKRRSIFLESFRRLMGYWHSFHMPFAIFMYVVAVIHILTATLLGVGEVI
jgi:hypothetical protein